MQGKRSSCWRERQHPVSKHLLFFLFQAPRSPRLAPPNLTPPSSALSQSGMRRSENSRAGGEVQMFAGRPGVGVGFTWPHSGPAPTFPHPRRGQLGIASSWVWLLPTRRSVATTVPKPSPSCHTTGRPTPPRAFFLVQVGDLAPEGGGLLPLTQEGAPGTVRTQPALPPSLEEGGGQHGHTRASFPLRKPKRTGRGGKESFFPPLRAPRG